MLTLGRRQTLVAVANGDNHEFVIAASETSKWAPGKYRYAAKVEKAGGVYTAAQGGVEVCADFQTTRDTDTRHHVEKVLDALEAVIEKKASKDQQELAFNGRQIKHMQPQDILKLRDYYKSELKRIKQQEAMNDGKTQTGIHKIRFR